MKRSILPVLLLAAATTFTACGTTGSSSTTGSVLGSVLSGVASNAIGGSSSSSSSSSTSSTASAASSIVGGLLSSILGSSSTLTQDDLVGTWTYSSPECAFESENLLAKAGGAVAASKIESELSTQLSKVGIKQGSCSFTFNSDNTYTATVGGKKINGTYTLDSKNKTVKMTYLAGLGSMTPKISKSGNSISLLYESDKLLTLLSTVSKLSGTTTGSTLSSLLGNYDGMYVGMKLKK